MITMTMLKLWKLNLLNLLFSWKCDHKCGIGLEDFQAFIISCICVEADHFLFQWYLQKLCTAIIKYFWYKSINSKPIPGPGSRVLVAPGKTPLFQSELIGQWLHHTISLITSNSPYRLLPLISTVTTATTSKSGSRETDLFF